MTGNKDETNYSENSNTMTENLRLPGVYCHIGPT